MFKKVDHEDFANYLPVSLTSVVCKAFERIFKRVILSFLSQCNTMDDGNTADVAYFDFAVGGNPLRTSSPIVGFAPKKSAPAIRFDEQACIAYSRWGRTNVL